MKKTHYILWIVLIPCMGNKLTAQLHFPFEHEYFNANGNWEGDTSSFIINAQQELQIQASSAGSSSIYHSIKKQDKLFWQFDFRLEFSPSQQNQLRFYLSLDDPTNIQNAYYIEIGESGTQDVIRFFKIHNGVKTQLAQGFDGLSSNNQVKGTIGLKYQNHHWHCYYLMDHLSPSIPQFEVRDSLLELNYFGIQCNYTSTRKDKFYFDNIIIGSLPIDMKAPTLDSIQVIDSLKVVLFFDEPLLNNSIQIDIAIHPHRDMGSIRILDNQLFIYLNQSLISGKTYELTVYNIMDLFNNKSELITKPIVFYHIKKAKRFDLLINEFMADPSPVIGLPEAEYIELKNRSSHYIALSDYTLSDNSKQVELPRHLMAPNEIVILSNITDTALFIPFGTVIGIENIPSLNNSDDDIIILDYLGNIIDFIQYDLSWYKNSVKSQGGWSIELKNEKHICKAANNYSASKNFNGGTPGIDNSFMDSTFMDLPLLLEDIHINDPYEIELHFNQSIIFDQQLIDNIRIKPTRTISNLTQDFIHSNIVYIELNEPMDKSVFYEIEFGQNIQNCLGTSFEISPSDSFALAEFPKKGDLLINEILFNPVPDVSDFIELINTSKKVLDLSQIKIGNINTRDSIIVFPNIKKQLPPGEIIALSTNPNSIISHYNPPAKNNILKSKLPPWDNEYGNVSVFQSYFGRTDILDQMDYDDDMHHPAISNVEGVSLERFDIDISSDQRSNWNSGAEFNNYASPGYVNGNVAIEHINDKEMIYLDQVNLSPNGDGLEDKLIIYYQLDKPNYYISISVFNIDGLFIKDITKGEIQGNHGFFVWDGIDSRNKLSNTGIYIILANILHSDGTRNCVKLPFVLKLP